MENTPRAPFRVVAAIWIIMVVIAVLGLGLLYAVAFSGPSPVQSAFAGVLFLLVAAPLFAALLLVALPYRPR